MQRARWVAGAWASALAIGGLALASARGDAEADYDDLRAQYEAAQEEFQKQIAEVRTKEGAQAAVDYERDWNPLPAFLDLFAAKGQEYEGTDGAAPFWIFVLTNDMRGEDGKPGSMCVQALDVLLEDHAENAAFLSQLEYLGNSASSNGLEPTLALIEVILEKSKSDAIRHRALFSRGVARAESKDEATRKLGFDDLRKVAELAPKERMGVRAQAILFEAENLQIGCVAPDIEGKDLSGVPFKLSDYRGKVVVVDFWGDW